MERAPHIIPSLIAGPLLGLSLIAFALLVHMGPGLALFCLVTAVSLIVLAPLFQLFLRKRQGLSSHPWLAAALSIASIVLLAVISTFTGIFDFW